MALKTIEHFKLSSEDIYFIVSDRYKLPVCSFKIIDFYFRRVSQSFNEQRNEIVQYISAYISIFKQLKFSSYTAYIPHTQGFAVILLSSFYQCKRYYIVEEGLSAYYDRQDTFKKFEGKLLNKLNWKGRIVHAAIYCQFGLSSYINKYFNRKFMNTSHHKFVACIGSNENTFPLVSKRIVIGLPFKKISLSESLLNTPAIIFFDAISAHNIIGLPEHVAAIQQLKDFIKSNKTYSYVSIRFHMDQKVDERNLILSMFDKEEFKYTILKDYVVMENCLYTLSFRKKTDIYINLSSLGIYAALCGHKVYSYHKFIKSYRYHNDFFDGIVEYL